MPRAPRLPIEPRKAPVQARSTQLVTDILAAALRVLEREGADRFTTVRVAKAAGVSVGSLYQYFPNKQAILFRLQVEEWARTGAMLEALLGDTRAEPAARLRTTVRAFFRSEQDEAPLRLALDVAAPSWHDATASRVHRARSRRIVRRFLAEAAPRATPAQRRFAGELLSTTLSALGKQLTDRKNPAIDRWADAVAEMLSGYLAKLEPEHGRSRLTVRARHGTG